MRTWLTQWDGDLFKNCKCAAAPDCWPSLSDALSKHRYRVTLPSLLLLLLLVHWPHLKTMRCIKENGTNDEAANLPKPDCFISRSAGNCAAVRRSCQQKNPEWGWHCFTRDFTNSLDSQLKSGSGLSGIKVDKTLKCARLSQQPFPCWEKDNVRKH